MSGRHWIEQPSPASDLSEGRNLWLWLILLAGMSVRLIGLDEPLVDHQAWRQTDTAAIARNFFEEGFDIFRPRVDWRGTTLGYVETNFPLYPFLAACTYVLAGSYHEWLGRLLSALFSTLTAALLYHLASRIYPGRPRLPELASLLYLAMPVNVYFGRTFMPEALMVFLSVASLLTFLRWMERPGAVAFSLAVLASALCFLVKIPTLYLGFPLVALAWWRWGGWRFLAKPSLWVFAILVLSPSIWWYDHAAGLFQQTGLTFGIWNRYGYDKWSHELLLEADFYFDMCLRLGHRVVTPVGAVLVLWGLVAAWPKRPRPPLPGQHSQGRQAPEWMPYVWLGGIALYVLLVPEGNRKLHYYQVPFVPVCALFAALPLARLATSRGAGGRHSGSRQSGSTRGRAVAAVVLLALAGYSAWSVSSYFRPGNPAHRFYRSSWEAGRLLDERIPPDALLVTGEHDDNAATPLRAQSPTLLYYCHRKGWQITLEQFSAGRLDSLSDLGASFFVTAIGFAMSDASFWRELLARGVTFPSAYPRQWTDDRRFRQAVAAHRGLDRNIVLVDLRRGRPAEGLQQPEPTALH